MKGWPAPQRMLGKWRRPPDCRRTIDQLQAYLDGEADADAAWGATRHLSRCEDCFGDAETLRVVKDALARLRTAHDEAALMRLRRIVTALTEPGRDG